MSGKPEPPEMPEHDKDLIEGMIWMQDGKIIVDSRLKDVSDLIPHIEDNIAEEDGEESIYWPGVWGSYNA